MFPLPPTTCAAALRGCFLPPALPPLPPPLFCLLPPPCCECEALRFCWADALVALFPTRVGRSLQAAKARLCVNRGYAASRREQMADDSAVAGWRRQHGRAGYPAASTV